MSVLRAEPKGEATQYKPNLQKEAEPIIVGILPDKGNRKHNPNISRRGLAASSVNNPPRTILTRAQLLECADSYTNDGIMRRLVNIMVFGIKGERVKFVVDPNEELTEFASDEELRSIQQSISTQDRVPELRKNIIRINKRCKLNENLDRFLKAYFVFGRALSSIVRFPTSDDFPIYGEPRAIRTLNVTRISEINVNKTTGAMDGILYDYGDGIKKVLKPTEIIFGVNDDNNLYDNTNFSGMSPVWTCLSASQSNLVINDENIPEATRSFSGKYGLLYAGTSKKSIITKLNELLSQGAFVIHNQEKLKAEVHDLARDLMELPNVRESNAKYMTWATMVPLFLVFEDTANFATANQALAAWKATTLTYYRTVVQGILEEFWYDPILADHFGITVEDVITQRIKVKPVFEDIVFDTYADQVQAVALLVEKGVYTIEQALEKLGEDKFLEQNRQMNAVLERAKEEGIKEGEEQAAKNMNSGGAIIEVKNRNTTTNAKSNSNEQENNA